MDITPTSSRPLTPDSPLRNILAHRDPSLHLDDDLTNSLLALRSFSSRSTTPLQLSCCCAQEGCENAREWRDQCCKLEKELVLSAEVGQALLHRYEAYVKSQEALAATTERKATTAQAKIDSLTSSNTQLLAKLSNLIKEHTALEKRLAQTTLNLEVADASNRTLLSELQEAREGITRLSAVSVRSVGLEAKVQALLMERDDLKEERRAEAAKARSAEAKASALADKCTKLQAEVYNLREERETRRISKADLSEELIRDARLRLETLHSTLSDLNSSTLSADAEFTKVLEGLVSENEALKHDNAELQNLLTDSREDIKGLREELEESRAAAPPTPETQEAVFVSLRTEGTLGRHKVKESWASSASAPVPLSPPRSDGFLSPRLPTSRIRTPSYSLSYANRRSIIHPRRTPSDHGDERPTDQSASENENGKPSASPTPSTSALQSRRTSLSHQSHHSHTPSTYSIEIDASHADGQDATEPAKGHRRKLLLLTRSRGTQTDPVTILPPSPIPPSHSGSLTEEKSGNQSETSSLQEGKVSQMNILLEKINALLARITQADVRTLTNRLKRQHLIGADVGHLSRSTISGILNEVSGLRSLFRGALEDERILILVSRKEFRALLKVFNELFQELGGLRASVNEVILNPAVATKLREEALSEEPKSTAKGGLGGWIAPLSKLWGAPSSETTESKSSMLVPPVGLGLGRNGTVKRGLAPKIAPKLAPAVSASTTTVNVEFSNAGIRRAISTTPEPTATTGNVSDASGEGVAAASRPIGAGRPQLAGIFAGSSGSTKPSSSGSGDQWATVPPTSGTKGDNAGLRPQGPSLRPPVGNIASKMGDNTRRMSRVVDAMVDQQSAIDSDEEEADDFSNSLLQRTLRPRGLSDSSVASHVIAPPGPVNRLLTPAGLALSSPTVANDGSAVGTMATSESGGAGGWLDKEAVWQGIRSGMGRLRLSSAVVSGSGQQANPNDIRARKPVNIPSQSASNTESSTPSSTPTPPHPAPLPVANSPKPMRGSIAHPSLASAMPRRPKTGDGSMSPTARAAVTSAGGIDPRGVSPRTTSPLAGLAAWANPTASLQGRNEENGKRREERLYGKRWE